MLPQTHTCTSTLHCLPCCRSTSTWATPTCRSGRSTSLSRQRRSHQPRLQPAAATKRMWRGWRRMQVWRGSLVVARGDEGGGGGKLCMYRECEIFAAMKHSPPPRGAGWRAAHGGSGGSDPAAAARHRQGVAHNFELVHQVAEALGGLPMMVSGAQWAGWLYGEPSAALPCGAHTFMQCCLARHAQARIPRSLPHAPRPLRPHVLCSQRHPGARSRREGGGAVRRLPVPAAAGDVQGGARCYGHAAALAPAPAAQAGWVAMLRGHIGCGSKQKSSRCRVVHWHARC